MEEMEIDWDKVTEDDREIIQKIAERVTSKHPDVSMLDMEMDISCVHSCMPLRLSDLLKADDFNFWHEILGIVRNLDRETGELSESFRPRYTA